MNTFARPILVGIDADVRSDAALSAALELARRFGGEVRALHAVPLAPILYAGAEGLPAAPVIGPDVLDTLRQRISARVAPLVERSGAGVKLDLRVVLGHPAQVLLEGARALSAGVVCLGPHRRRGVVDFGSTARAVLARAPGAVWLQPENPAPIRSVLAAVDLSEQSLHALRAARDLAGRFGARLDVLYVFQPPDLTLMAIDEAALPPLWDVEALRRAARADFDRAMAAFDWQGVPHEARFVEGDPGAAILARQDAADLIVLGTHGRTGLLAFLLGSVAYAVLRAARRPVLAIRHPERSFLTA
jgi:nucleotide-binding universal stress UspA family protein